jgi:hypothetical protein
MVQKIMPQTYHDELQPDAMRGSEQFLVGVDYIDLAEEELVPVTSSQTKSQSEKPLQSPSKSSSG